MNSKTVIIIGAILVVILVIVYARNNDKAKLANEGARVPAAVAVEATTIASEPIKEIVAAVGTIEAWQDVMVSSETGGRVTSVNIKVGDLVRSGQVLVQVDDELKAIAVEQAQAQLLAAETNFKKMEKDFQRAETIFSSNGISDADLESARLGLRAAEAQYKSAQVALKLAQRHYNDCKIKAPIAGEIASRLIDTGEMVGPGREIANIIDVSQLKVKLSITEEQIGKIQKGQLVRLFLDESQPGFSFQGKVYSVGSKTITPNGHSYPVEILVENRTAGTLKVGMFVQTKIETATVENAVTVGKECLVNEESQPALFFIENNIAHLKPIKLGISADDKVQILSGANPGDKVVSFGQNKIKDGAQVKYE